MIKKGKISYVPNTILGNAGSIRRAEDSSGESPVIELQAPELLGTLDTTALMLFQKFVKFHEVRTNFPRRSWNIRETIFTTRDNRNFILV